jgi:hypothetical protein
MRSECIESREREVFIELKGSTGTGYNPPLMRVVPLMIQPTLNETIFHELRVYRMIPY